MKSITYRVLGRWHGWCLVATLAACGSQPAPVTRPESRDQLSLGPVTVVKGGESRFRHVIREVIRDSSRWRVLRDSLHPTLHAPPESPAIDFRREMLVVAVGPSGPSNDSVVIGQVSRTEQGIRVLVIFHRECSAFMLSSLPFHVVRVPRSSGNAVFEETEVSGPVC